MQPRAYSVLHIKAVDDERRVISGMATTPDIDRVGDIIEPRGAKFKNPLPLLLHHDSRLPVGTVSLKRATDDGVPFEASIPKIATAGSLKNRVDEAWDSIKAGLIQGVSIGFNALEDGVELMRSGGFRFTKIEILELSLVAIPANASATITTIKSLDTACLAASGRGMGDHTSGDTDERATPSKTKVARVVSAMKTSEQISAYEATRQAKHARMEEMMTKAAKEGVTFDEAEQEEYDGLSDEVKQIDGHLNRLNNLKK
jgi:HK97 family phage prohead protease